MQQKNYRTSNQGVAAYCVSKGYEITHVSFGIDRNGVKRKYARFNMDADTGKRLSDEFFATLGDFYNKLSTVRSKFYEVGQQ